jgi:hypothetical protein
MVLLSDYLLCNASKKESKLYNFNVTILMSLTFNKNCRRIIGIRLHDGKLTSILNSLCTILYRVKMIDLMFSRVRVISTLRTIT